MGGNQWDVDVTALGDGLAAVHSLKYRELPGPLLKVSGDAVQVASPYPTRGVAPMVLKGGPGGDHGSVHVLSRTVGHLGKWLPGGRTDRGEGPTRLCGYELTADEVAVPVSQTHHRCRLEGWCVVQIKRLDRSRVGGFGGHSSVHRHVVGAGVMAGV